MTEMASALLLVIVAQLALLTALAVWAWWNLTRGPRGAWIADAHSATVERDEKAEQHASDMYDALTEVQQLLARIAANPEESAVAAREEGRR